MIEIASDLEGRTTEELNRMACACPLVEAQKVICRYYMVYKREEGHYSSGLGHHNDIAEYKICKLRG